VTATLEQCADFLRFHDNYLIITHKRPDGDTVGSACALLLGLRAIGKTAFMLDNPQITPRFEKYLLPYRAAADFSGIAIAVDTASESLFPDTAEVYKSLIKICIDHHASNTDYAERTFVDSGAAACGEIILKLLGLIGAPLSSETAEAVYVAVSTDTGCFSFSNTTAESFLAAAKCAETGINIAELNRVLFRTKTKSRTALEAYIYSNAVFFADGRAVIVSLPQSTIDALRATEDDLDNISSLPASIEGVAFAATIREVSGAENIKVSLRSNGGFNSDLVCRKFGGGGHEAAAGYSLTSTLEETANSLRAALETVLGGL